MPARPHRPHSLLVSLVAVAALAACGRPLDRPISGALPGSSLSTPTSGVPPTLAANLRFSGLAEPSPGLGPGAAPLASPSPNAQPPIVRTVQPPANASLPESGPVVVSAALVGRGADLATATLTIDGADAGVEPDRRDPRQWTVSVSQPLAPGPHTARVLVRDTTGASGGFTWQFTVGEPVATPEPTPPPDKPEPPGTPPPVPVASPAAGR